MTVPLFLRKEMFLSHVFKMCSRAFFQFVGDLAELKEKDYGSGQQPISKRDLIKPPAPEVGSCRWSFLLFKV